MFRLGAAHRRPETSGGIELVPMRRRHLKAVVEIEQQIFPTPWSLTLYLSELSLGANRAYYVARAGNQIVGYAGLMLAVGEAHVTTIGVDPAWQRRGIGRRLLLVLATVARQRGATDLTLEVRASNTGAQALYHEFGFVPAGIRKNYYAEVNEDAIVMWAHDIQSSEYAERLGRIAARLAAEGGESGEGAPPEPGGQAGAAP